MIKVYHLPYTHPNYGFFEAFLHVEEEFIPKNFFVSCPFEGRANNGRPIQPFCPNGLDWPAVVSPALKRTRCEKHFGYKFFFYMQKGFKKPIIWMGILQVYTFIILDKCAIGDKMLLVDKYIEPNKGTYV